MSRKGVEWPRNNGIIQTSDCVCIWNKQVGYLVVMAAGSPQAAYIPGVDDLYG
jgi:hypothetical protein